MRDRIITISPPYPWVLHMWIQPTTDGKYLKKNKIPESKTWICCTLTTIYIVNCKYGRMCIDYMQILHHSS